MYFFSPQPSWMTKDGRFLLDGKCGEFQDHPIYILSIDDYIN